MSAKEKKDKKDVVDNKTTINKVIKQKEKNKKDSIEGLDQGFITKWVM